MNRRLYVAAGLSAADTPKGPALKEADANPPGQNKVTITADIVMVFMNSAK